MMSVIQRHGYSIKAGGAVHFDDRPSTYEAADQIAERRLDRRKNYAIIDGAVCESLTWSGMCSGCTVYGSGDDGAGLGCDECGYTGRRRTGMWVPLGSSRDIP